MKIRELDLDRYVIVYDIGKSENNNGMTVVGRVEEIVFNDDGENAATINSLGNLYDITDDNEFELWAKSIEGKTESIGTTIKWNDDGNLEVEDNYEIKVPDEVLNNNSNLVEYVKGEINTHRSSDVQQKKRFEHLGVKPNDTVNHPSHYNYGDIEVINFIEQVTQHYNPNVAYHIGNAIKYLARSPHKNGKEDVAKAKWYIERAYDNWDVK